jgi:tetratricopeptide (TPR) repeat protein
MRPLIAYLAYLPMRLCAPHGLAALITLVSLAPACSTTTGRRLVYTPNELRAEVARRAPDLPADSLVIPFEVDAEQIDKASRVVAGYAARGDQVRALVDAIFKSTAFNLHYAPVVTTTAGETLARHEGNCLSLASVFVGLARALGLKAYYLDASARVSEVTHRDPGLAVNAGHITAVAEIDSWRWYLDFDRSLGNIHSFRVLDDVEALAHFYNNRGYERMEMARLEGHAVDWEQAASDFIIAVRVEPNFARAWNNLGVAHARAGRLAEAEKAYRRAIAGDAKIAAAYNNLGTLYESERRLTEGVAALRQAVALEPNSAHTHYNLGRALLLSGQYAAGIASLERAAALRNDSAAALLNKLALYRTGPTLSAPPR